MSEARADIPSLRDDRTDVPPLARRAPPPFLADTSAGTMRDVAQSVSPQAPTPQPTTPFPSGLPGGGASPRLQTVNYWVEKGVPVHVAQGIADNVSRESGFNPTIAGDNGTSVGLYQAHDDRMRNLQQSPGWQNPRAQHDWAYSQVTGGDAIATQHWNEIKGAKTREEAGRLWREYFERPAGSVGAGQVAARGEGQMQLRTVNEQIGRLLDEVRSTGGRDKDTWRRLDEARTKMLDYERKALELAEKPPTADPRDAMQRLGGLATVVGILGGLLTKQPLMASLNAGGAAMEAYNKQDDATYQYQREQWKHHTDMLLKLAQFQHEQLRDTLEDEKLQSGERWQKFQVVASLLGHEQAIAMGQLQDERGTRQFLQQMDQSNKQFSVQMAKLEQGEEKVPSWKQYSDSLDRQWQQEHGGQAVPEDVKREHIKEGMSQAPSGASAQSAGSMALRKFLEENPSATSKEINEFVQNQRPPRSGQAAAVRKFMEENPSATSEDIVHFNAKMAREIATERVFGAGFEARSVNSMNTVADHLSLLREAANALHNKDIQRINALRMRSKTEFGGKDPTVFAVAREIASDEIARAVIGGVGSETSRENMRKLINSSQSSEQLEANIREAERFIGGRLESLRRQYAGNDPERRKTFDEEMLSERAKNALTMAQPGSDVGGGGTYASPDDVYRAFDAGTLTREQAKQILIDKFGAKPNGD